MLHHQFLIFHRLLSLGPHLELLQQSQLVLVILSLLELLWMHFELLLLFDELSLLVLEFIDNHLLLLKLHLHLLKLYHELLWIIT